VQEKVLSATRQLMQMGPAEKNTNLHQNPINV